jgi:hypothetical protein
MSQTTNRTSGHGFVESAAEELLKEKDWHEQQIARIEFILENMKHLVEGKPFGTEKSSKRRSEASEPSYETPAPIKS